MFLNKAGIAISPTTESLHLKKNYKLSFDYELNLFEYLTKQTESGYIPIKIIFSSITY